MSDTDRRVRKLAQAVQVGDLLADRVDQYSEAVRAYDQTASDADLEWVRMAGINLVRAVDAYRSVRE